MIHGRLEGPGVGGAEPFCSAADVEGPLLAGRCAVTKEAGAQAGTRTCYKVHLQAVAEKSPRDFTLTY